MSYELTCFALEDHMDIPCIAVTAIVDDGSNKKVYEQVTQYWYGKYQSYDDAYTQAFKLGRKLAHRHMVDLKIV